MRRATLIPLLLASAALGPAVEVETVDYDLADRVRSDVQAGTERIYRALRDSLGLDFPKPPPISIRIFGEFDAYKEFQKKVSETSRSDTGMYSDSRNEIIVYRGENAAALERVVFHETTHLLLRDRVRDCPSWIGEGLAEYFEGLSVLGRSARVLPQRQKDRRLKRWALEDQLEDLGKFVLLSNQAWRKRNEEVGYPASTTSWSLATFFMATKDRRAVLSRILKRLRSAGGRRKASANAIRACYPGGIAGLTRDWREWIPRSRTHHRY